MEKYKKKRTEDWGEDVYWEREKTETIFLRKCHYLTINLQIKIFTEVIIQPHDATMY